MSSILGNAVIGLPALLGVLLGLKIYADGLSAAGVAVAAAVASYLVMAAGRGLMGTRPVLGGWLIEVWIVSAVCVTALATFIVVEATLKLPIVALISRRALDKDAAKTVTDAFITAVSTYVALVWTKDIGDAKGPFWPSTQFKAAIQKACDRLAPKPERGTAPFQAIWDDSYIEGVGQTDWGFRARRKRAEILAKFLKTPAKA